MTAIFPDMVPAIAPERLPQLIDIVRWIVAAGNVGRSERGLTEGLANLLVEAGIPVHRISMGSNVLDPVLQSRSYVWTAETGTEPMRFERGLRQSENWLKSTLYWMMSNEQSRLRVPLDSARANDFPLLVSFRERGYTDYYARLEAYGERAQASGARGLMATFTSRDPAGFSDEHLAFLDAVLPAFALAFLARLNTRILARALSTYLGKTPAERVLKGEITRGQGQTVDAIVWMSDLSGFTKTADALPREDILEFLNAHAEIVSDAIEAHGGEVLKFIGDGILAVFPRANAQSWAASQALDAAIRVQVAAKIMANQRREQDKPSAEIIISLHRGDVLFGNFGSQDRLDFTALGSAVNEASRICSLAKTLDQKLLVSDDFKEVLPPGDDRLVSVGRYALRGVADPKHLYTLDRAVVRV
ncbi:MAG TPA: adenylate/guanylate cyclase domain-containing protein [Beijerinckiaceae bacterium]|nr:adenylate/guanylate cyclase domain-containing protein [Beijerinckiaceae bacterium]